MQFIKYPVDAFSSSLSHADKTIFLHLLLRHFHFCRGDYSVSFYVTDRDLSEISGCSTRSIWKSKFRLKDSGLITFEIGDKNKTFYKICSDNGDSKKPTPV